MRLLVHAQCCSRMRQSDSGSSSGSGRGKQRLPLQGMPTSCWDQQGPPLMVAITAAAQGWLVSAAPLAA